MSRRKRFRWTRKAYKHAAWLSRYAARHPYDFPGDPPLMLIRLWELRKFHPQKDDPLLVPARVRYAERFDDDSIPF